MVSCTACQYEFIPLWNRAGSSTPDLHGASSNKIFYIIKTTDIVLDNSIYPRNGIDHKKVSMFEYNMRDGFEFDISAKRRRSMKKRAYRILLGKSIWIYLRDFSDWLTRTVKKAPGW